MDGLLAQLENCRQEGRIQPSTGSCNAPQLTVAVVFGPLEHVPFSIPIIRLALPESLVDVGTEDTAVHILDDKHASARRLLETCLYACI